MPSKSQKDAVVGKAAKAAKAAKPAKDAKVAKAAKPAKDAKSAKSAKPAKSGKAAKPKVVQLTKEQKKEQRKISKKRRNANPLFEKKAKVFAIGRDINKHRDLTRYVLWPKYIRLQRQKKVLYSRLRVPPAINQFSRTLDKNTAIELFKILMKYRPETPAAAKARRLGEAARANQKRLAAKAKFADKKNKKDEEKKPLDKAAIKAAKAAAKKAAAKKAKEAPHKYKRKNVVKCGVNHVTSLVESKRAKLVLIANDVDPIELVVWLPTLCKKMNVPFAIVKNKARLGKVVGKKTATCLALTNINACHQTAFNRILAAVDANFTQKYEENRRHWGGNRLGMKSRHAQKKKAVALAKEKAKQVRK